MIVVLAEKPAVARELAAVLGATQRREGYLEGAGYRVTWARGHLVRLAEPAEMNPAWRTWSRAALPMLPEAFRLTLVEGSRAQYRVVEKLLRDRETEGLIAATDAGREGELIFRYVYEHARCRKPWRRLWLSSLTPAAIRSALAQLEPGSRYDGLASAARARSQADWLVGMNLSRAYTLSSGELFSVGRVQTPTLAMVVQRDREIREFVPEPYLEVEATFEHARGRYRGTYYAVPPQALWDERGRLRAFQPLRARLPADGELAKRIAARAKTGVAKILGLDRSLRRTPPPLLYDLTELQRHANQLYGYTAQRTLDAAQELYEAQLLSYPRTDSRHLSTAVAAGLPEIVGAIAPRYPGLVAAGSGGRPLGSRYVDDRKVSDHHAILPTAKTPARELGEIQRRIYDLVCRRLLAAWHADLVEAVTRVVSEVRSEDAQDLFASQGIAIEALGWKLLDPVPARAAPNAKLPIPAGLALGDPLRVEDVVVHRKQTQPPKPLTEATLLTAMETAGKQLDDKALIDALRGAGLGTPATRAAILETLIARRYLERVGKSLRATASGVALIAAVHPLVKSAEMTGRWEQRLARMERGEERFEPFMRDIADYVKQVVAHESQKPQPARKDRGPRRRKPKVRRWTRRGTKSAGPSPRAKRARGRAAGGD
ncbi:MAG TPA: DNA topoisomerase 3 [Polyangiales bacterium]|nr:DNA topoisomerase 3 [Polyangiales bacterium]